LEQKVDERTQELKLANEKAENLLLNILPKDIAAELTEHPDRVIARRHTKATVLFTDIVGFTKMSSVMSPEKIITMLNKLFSKFDERAKDEGVEKIKTIGDAYMAAIGLNESEGYGGVEKMIYFAEGLLEDVNHFNEITGLDIQIRIGINTGDLVAAVIGKSKFIYDIWGDTVNVASRMESTGEPMKIHVSESTYELTKEEFDYSESVSVSVKGKGEMNTYFLE
jgi:class 3 adenylate cyclase